MLSVTTATPGMFAVFATVTCHSLRFVPAVGITTGETVLFSRRVAPSIVEILPRCSARGNGSAHRSENGPVAASVADRVGPGVPGMLMYVTSTRPVGPLNCVVKLHGCPGGATLARGKVIVTFLVGFHPPCEVSPVAAHGGPCHVRTSPVVVLPDTAGLPTADTSSAPGGS
ncbi:hypothetical protein G5T42_05120 [Microbacterium sp. 4R-513]|uniref:hypothetical protein n=1 Tax=Microbacterium sp. 4R-513 TaxID=2567934 RepID=UPI0013E1BDA0|nr:hypothetical protein [Microbacterium sp. 4R-513]QIG38945.1 hypothetical protein G5T42_05120 [Microbacterium sp. 4R-513]